MKDTWKGITIIAIIVLLVTLFDATSVIGSILSFIFNLFGSILKITELVIIVLAIIVVVIVFRKKKR